MSEHTSCLYFQLWLSHGFVELSDWSICPAHWLWIANVIRSCIPFGSEFVFSIRHTVHTTCCYINISYIMKSWPCESLTVSCPPLEKGENINTLVGISHQRLGHDRLQYPAIIFPKVSNLSWKKKAMTICQAAFWATHQARGAGKQLARTPIWRDDLETRLLQLFLA